MDTYRYKAINKDGNSLEGEVRGNSRESVLEDLKKDGFLVVKLENKNKRSQFPFADRLRMSLSAGGGVGTLDKILLVRHLSVALKAGIGLQKAMTIVLDDVKKPAMKKMLHGAKEAIERGEALSSFFENYPRYFSPVFIGLLKAGETSGTLEAALENLYDQLFRDYDLLKKVRMAMAYPAILLVGSAGIIVLMLVFVLPRIAKAFHGFVKDLPFLTRFFIGASAYVGARPFSTLAVLILIIGFALYVIRSSRGRIFIYGILQRLPVSSELIKKLALARFSRTFKNLLSSGVSAIEAIRISSGTVANPTYKLSLKSIGERLVKGGGLADSFRSRPDLYPSMFSSLISIGEETGTLEKSLSTLSVFYDEEVDRLLKNLVSLVEPILIFIMGIVVALIALSVLLPIFRLIRTFQQF
ncbi:type II secretion system F family protein [Candidatus Wolfebacteria bacterium]|nr:type II secretion system F family protein [Candidatus Wolfebacteria bacterium]